MLKSEFVCNDKELQITVTDQFLPVKHYFHMFFLLPRIIFLIADSTVNAYLKVSA